MTEEIKAKIQEQITSRLNEIITAAEKEKASYDHEEQERLNRAAVITDSVSNAVIEALMSGKFIASGKEIGEIYVTIPWIHSVSSNQLIEQLRPYGIEAFMGMSNKDLEGFTDIHLKLKGYTWTPVPEELAEWIRF